MSQYTLEELIARWKREELSVEQMVGQLVQALAAHEQRLRAVERRVPEERAVVAMTKPAKGETRRK